MTIIRKTAVAAVAAAAFAGAVAVTPAEAGWRGHRGGAPIAAGIIGGLALGALAAGSANAYHAPRPYYAPPAYGAAYGAYGGCHLERQSVHDRWGRFAGWRRVRVCY